MPYTVKPARLRPLPTKRISAGVPVRPWISSTPARPPRSRKSACLIMDCVMLAPIAVRISAASSTKLLSGDQYDSNHDGAYPRPAAQRDAFLQDVTAGQHRADVAERREGKRDAELRPRKRREPQHEFHRVHRDAQRDPRRVEYLVDERRRAGPHRCVADPQLEAHLARHVAGDRAEQQQKGDKGGGHGMAVVRQASNSVRASSTSVRLLSSIRRGSVTLCRGWSNFDSIRFSQFAWRGGEYSPQTSAPRILLWQPTARSMAVNAASGMRP